MKLNIFAFLIVAMGLCLTGCNKDDEDSSESSNEVVAEFTVDATEYEAGDSVYFTNESQYASYYQWDFGDDGLSFDENPTYVYSKSGSYDVQLIAIGESGGSDTASVTLSITNSNTSIYEGVGIDGVTLYSTTWGDLSDTYGTDTTYYTIYNTQTSGSTTYYLRYFLYDDEGLVFYVYGTSTKMLTTDLVFAIAVMSPYDGETDSNIGIGSDMDLVEDAYGTPEDTYESTSYYAYWYDSKGIDFYSYNTGEVDEIDIYAVSSSSRSDHPQFEMQRDNRIVEKISGR